MLDPRQLFASSQKEDKEDIDRFARMSPEERLQLFVELCEVTHSIVQGRPNAEQLLAPTPRSEESLALWQRLMLGYEYPG